MSINIIQQRLNTYHYDTQQDEENALKEISQEIALLALSRTDFFTLAAFQGDTCLRILYGLNRFSEDLDFILQTSGRHFNWETYFKGIVDEFNIYGYEVSVQDRSKVDLVVKKAFIKDDSIGKLLVMQHTDSISKKIQIKIEIDTNPPTGSHFERKYLDFPAPFSVVTQDLPSLFAGKSHALLCRNYVKGRDWYDFIWYISRRTKINFELLESAIDQVGPWQAKKTQVDKKWYLSEMRKKIQSIDFDAAKNDVKRFLKSHEAQSLDLWSQEFFLSRIDVMEEYL